MDSPTPKLRLWKIPFAQLLAQLPPIIRRIATSQCRSSELYAKSNVRVCAFRRASIRARIHAIIGADGTHVTAPMKGAHNRQTWLNPSLDPVANSNLISRELKVSLAHGPTCVLIVIGSRLRTTRSAFVSTRLSVAKYPGSTTSNPDTPGIRSLYYI